MDLPGSSASDHAARHPGGKLINGILMPQPPHYVQERLRLQPKCFRILEHYIVLCP